MNEIPKNSNLSKRTLERLILFYKQRTENLILKHKNNPNVKRETNKT